jgi:ABC-type lipoprotein export system ATPase subunit
MVTHNPALAAMTGRTIRMRDGRIESDGTDSDGTQASD